MMQEALDLLVKVDLDPAILWAFVISTGLLLLKVLLGISVAIKDGTFDVRRMPEFLATNVLPYLLPLAGMAAMSIILPAIKIIYLSSVSLYGAKLLADIKDKINTLYLLVTTNGINEVQ